MQLPLDIAPKVGEALSSGAPVVALESTIITHGLPKPRNLEVARGVARVVEMAGAVPAIIAVADGALKVGLEDDALEALAAADDVMKLSRADLAVALAAGKRGSTTVSATMIA
ncbi:MAG: pseudouridine-5'-phosphate glycosidase, partial [Pseudomonadota bacterium]